ncbi:MAG TPA: PKD domain-containing protein, partial [Anaerolineaceae bacterium]|nr:PKD domain-containing protein [Anaerolineaceae bacterium]
LGLSVAFTAQTSPADATLPLTYTWQASGQDPVTHPGGLVDTVQFTWTEPGEQQITVTVTSAYGGPVTSTLIVLVLPAEIKNIFLPITLR